MSWFDELFISEVKGALKPGSGGSVTLPFGDETISSIVWDGKIGDRIIVENYNYNYVYMGDYTLESMEEASSIRTIFYQDGELIDPSSLPNPPEDLESGDGFFMLDTGVVFVPRDNYCATHVNNRIFPKRGVYFITSKNGTFYAQAMYWPTEKVFIRQIEEKYIPEHLSVESILDVRDVEITWDGGRVARGASYLNVSRMHAQFNSTYWTYIYRKVSTTPLTDFEEAKSITKYEYTDKAYSSSPATITEKYDVSANESGGTILIECSGRYNIVSCAEDNATHPDLEGIVFPEKGLWMLYCYYTKDPRRYHYVSKFTIPRKRHHIKPEFLPPEPVHAWEDIVDKPFMDTDIQRISYEELYDHGDRTIVPGNTQNIYFVHVSDFVATAEQLIGVNVTVHYKTPTGGENTTKCQISGSYSCPIVVEPWYNVLFIPEDNFTFALPPSNIDAETVFPKKGVYFARLHDAVASKWSTVELIFDDAPIHFLKPIDSKFLPSYPTTEELSAIIDSKVSDSLIIPSSTEGSTKRFKIKVDDDGVITAERLPEKIVIVQASADNPIKRAQYNGNDGTFLWEGQYRNAKSLKAGVTYYIEYRDPGANNGGEILTFDPVTSTESGMGADILFVDSNGNPAIRVSPPYCYIHKDATFTNRNLESCEVYYYE